MAAWFSPNRDKARAEVFFLAYSPVWMTAVAVVMLTGALRHWNDVALMSFSTAVFVPLVVVPAWLQRGSQERRPFHRRYWLKFNVWIAVMVWAGTYFYSHYFFELMGMYYGFASHWHWEAVLMGRPENRVPLFLYPLTHAYFVTYYTVMIVCLRRVREATDRRPSVTALTIVFLAYAIAFMETLFMANDLMADFFHYRDKTEMLTLGSTMFALIFIASLPFAYRIDEEPGRQWTLRRTCIEALAASMIALALLDLWASVVGPTLR